MIVVDALAAGALVFDANELIAQDFLAIFLAYFSFLLDLNACIALESRNEVSARAVDLVPPVVIAISLVEDIGLAALNGHLAAYFDVVHIRRGDDAFHRRPAIGCHQYMYLQPSRAVAVVAFGPVVVPQSFQRNRSGIEQVEKIAHLLPQATAHLGHQVLANPFKQSCRALVVGISQR